MPVPMATWDHLSNQTDGDGGGMLWPQLISCICTVLHAPNVNSTPLQLRPSCSYTRVVSRDGLEYVVQRLSRRVAPVRED